MLKKRLQKDATLHEKHTDFMADLLQKSHARKVTTEEQLQREKWYLPHHPVFHPQKPGKVRAVFNCSAKYRGSFLNDQLLQGPDVTNTLVGVLTQFQEDPVAFMTDVEAMFYRVRVQPDNCKYLRFFWWPHGDLNQRNIRC